MIEKRKFIATPMGNMPFDWKKYTLSELSEFITKGATPTTYGFKWQDSGITFLRSECVSELGYSESGVAFISKEAHDAMERSKIEGGDILISITGNVGRIAVYPLDKTEGNINQHIARVRIIKKEIANREFIYYQLNQRNYRNYYLGIITGAAYPQLSLKQIRETSVYLPPLQTQKRIADILSAYDDLIENNLKRIKLLEQAAQNIYKEWFVNLRFPGYENTPINEETGLPEGWEEKTISEVMEYKVDNRGKNPKYYTKSGIPVIDNHLIKSSPHIDFSKTKRYINDELFDVFIRRYLKKDDVLITLVGTVANISLAPEEKSVIIQNTIGIRCNEFCTQEYMYCFLGANKTKIQNKNRGAAQPSVKVGDLTAMKMIIPNNELLNNFSKEIKTMFSLIQTLGKQNSKLKAARDILLPRLMNRTIEV